MSHLLTAAMASLALFATAAVAMPPAPPLSGPELAAYLQAAEQADRIEEGEARCLAYPDLPRLAWPRDMVGALCRLQRAPRFDVATLQARLAAPAGRAEVTRAFDGLLRQHRSVAAERDQVFVSLRAIESSPQLDAAVAAWVRAEPANAWGQLAQGLRLVGAAQDQRGTRYIEETPPARLRAARELAAQAVVHLQKAWSINPELSPACEGLVRAYRLAGDRRAGQAGQECVASDPDSFFVAMAWRGSATDQAFDAHLKAHAGRNPALGMLRAGVAMREFGHPSEAAMPRLLVPLLQALRFGPDPNLLNNLSSAYNQLGQDGLGLAVLSQAVRFDRGYSHYRFVRAFHNQFSRPAWAVLDLERLLAAEPGNTELARMLREQRGELEKAARASAPASASRQEFEAFVAACGKFADRAGWTPAEQLAADPMRHCDDEVIARWPGEVEAWRVRADVLHNHKRPGFEEAARKYLQMATPGSPDFYSHENRFLRWLGEL